LKKLFILFLLEIVISTHFPLHADTTILPDDPRIQYSGRIDFSDPRAPRFDWPGVSIQVNLKGDSLGFLLQDNQNRFDVWVDGKPQTVLIASPHQSLYRVDSLGPGEHRLQLTKRTESSLGPAVFQGLSLPTGVELLEPPTRATRRIEVIGDSWVCGYGNEAASVHCDDQSVYENANRGFGLVAARELKAEAHLVAYSGRGVVRNFADPQRSSAEPFPALYDRLLCAEPQSLWDFQSWVPDAVVIHLGTNDFSTTPTPDPIVFEQGCLALLTHLRALYPDASLFWFCATGWPNYYLWVEAAVKTKNDSGDKKVYCVGYPPVPQDQMGCDYHPNVKVHQKLATRLAQTLRQKLGWRE
jgi:lysophospholipase L1-like esterase